MANSSISTRIALEGGDQLKKQLADIGTTGKQALDNIAFASRDAGTALNSFSSSTGAFGGLLDELTSIVSIVAKLGAGFIGLGAIISAVSASAKSSITSLADLADKLKASIDQLRALQFAANASGNGDKLTGFLEKIKKSWDEATASVSKYHREVNAPGPENKTFFPGSGVTVFKPGTPGTTGKNDIGFDNLKLPDGANDYEKFLKGINAQLQEMKGAAKDAFGAFLDKKFGDGFASALPGIVKELELARETFKHLGEDQSAAAQAIAKDWKEASDKLGTALTEQKAIIKASVQTILQDLGQLFASSGSDKQDILADFIDRHKFDVPDFVANYIRPAIGAIKDFKEGLSGLSESESAAASGGDRAAKSWAGSFGASLRQSLLELRTTLAGYDFLSFDGIKNAATDAFNALIKAAINAFNYVAEHASDLWKRIGDALASVDWAAIWSKFKDGAVAAFNSVVETLSKIDWSGLWAGLLSSAADAFNSLRARLASIDYAAIWENLKSSAQAAWDFITTLVLNAWSNISEKLRNVDWGGVWDGLKSGAQAAWEAIIEVVGNAYVAIRTKALATFPVLTEAWRTMERVATDSFDAIKTVSANTWIAIGAGLLVLVGVFRGSFTSMLLLAAPFWRQILAGAETLAPGLRTALAPMLTAAEEAFAGIRSIASSTWNYVRALFSGNQAFQAQAWTALSESAAQAWTKVASFFSAGYAAIRAQAIAAAPWLKEPWEAMEASVAKAWERIKAEHASGYQTVKKYWDDIKAIWAGVEKAANGVASAINLIFGTNLSGTDLIILAVFLQIIGLGPLVVGAIGLVAASFGLLSASIGLLTSLGAAMGVLAANPWAIAIIAAIVLIGAAIFELYTHWDGLKAYVQQKFEEIKADIAAFGEWLVSSSVWDAMVAAAQKGLDALKSGFLSVFDSVKAGFADVASWIGDKLDGLLTKLGKLAQGIGNSGGLDPAGGSGAPGFAGGGLFRGSGTGTSDSNLAWISNGEFIIRNAAVEHYGPNFFHALNRMLMPKGSIPRFADGGLMGSVSGLSNAFSSFMASWSNLPRFADGGLANLSSGMSAALGSLVLAPTFNVPAPAAAGVSGRPVHVTIGGQTFGPMMASDDVAKGLERKAASQQMASAMTRSPGWKR
jgi:hypothetical protein